MPVFLALIVFVSVAAGSLYLCRPMWQGRMRALERVAPPETGPASAPEQVRLTWREVAERIGSTLPALPGNPGYWRQRLVRAGYRGDSALRVFNAIRTVSTLGLATLGLTAALHFQGPGDGATLAGIGGAVLGFLVPARALIVRMKRRQHRIARALPNVLDLLVICIESGLGLDQAILQVAKELQGGAPDICDELTLVNLEIRAGKRRQDALHNLADRSGVDELRKLVAVLVQTDRFGTSIAQSLRSHAEFMRVMARQNAEERAAKLPAKIIFAVFFCVFPSLFVVTVGPVITRLIRDLIPMLDKM